MNGLIVISSSTLAGFLVGKNGMKFCQIYNLNDNNMQDHESKEINNLLQQVSLIVKNYDKIAEITGEKYNVFNILGLGNDELSHSAILTNLLNAKGSHGQGAVFLELFIEILFDRLNTSSFSDNEGKSILFNEKKINSLNQFDIQSSKALKEKDLGPIDWAKSTGGRIDIIISDNKSNIIIENKIYALDQEQQLVRYKNYDVNAPIFYLNLFGDNPDEKSIKDNDGNIMKLNEDFFIISYKNEIVEWLHKCVEKVVNKPFLRETLNQYLNLIKRNTNQSNNNVMSEDIINVLKRNTENFNAAINISANLEYAKTRIWDDFGKKLLKELKQKLPNAFIEIDENFGLQYKNIRIKKNVHDNRFLHLSFLTNNSDIYIEIHPGFKDGKPIQKDMNLRNLLAEKLNNFNGRTNIKIEDTIKGWQGEWVCRYNVLSNKFDEMIDDNQTLLQQVCDDLIEIYTNYLDSI
jgi:hypothetical protein